MKYIKLFEEYIPFKVGDIVKIIKTTSSNLNGKKFKIAKIEDDLEPGDLDRIHLNDLDGLNSGWIYRNKLELVPDYEVDAEKYNI